MTAKKEPGHSDWGIECESFEERKSGSAGWIWVERKGDVW